MLQIPRPTLEKQKKASDPGTSIWVSAHAGSGKTHVLAQRVMRILLRGVSPGKILCLTFTKAAAANMSERVFRRLAEWTRCDDEALRREIRAIGAPDPKAADLQLARKLFARAVETPGGLKIQTLHAFCERLLHLFPFEANVPSRFTVIEDDQQKDMLEQARHTVLRLAEGVDHELCSALQTLTESCSDSTFEKLIDAAMSRRASSRAARTAPCENSLRKALGLGPEENLASITRSIIEEGIKPSRWPEIAAFLETGSKTDQTRAEAFRAAYAIHKEEAKAQECAAVYHRIFFTNDGKKAQRLLTSDLVKERPDLLENLTAEQDRLDALTEKQKAAATLTRTLALLSITDAIFSLYDRMKATQGLLDFNDLVERTRALLTRSDARWVLYKLDSGIDHILIDEAQDTSEAQWKILEELTSEFASGYTDDGRTARRTFFAVGDEKQSIFSFQGAAPHMFDGMRRRFDTFFRNGQQNFDHVRLTDSFRSVPGILDTVDRIFSHENHFQGLVAANDPWMPHSALKTKVPGLIELWPLVQPAAVEERREWTLPVDMPDAQDPPGIVAARVAQKIARLLADRTGERVSDGKGGLRRIQPGDILILVRKRGAFFDAIIRAMKQLRIPVAGADRLAVLQHIAVLDLIAAGRAALLPQDDLTLACVLKSPLIGLTDEDLIALAPNRTGSLFLALQQSDHPRYRAAAAAISTWHGRIGLPPFTFYAQMLGTDGGRRALEGRLGPEAADAIDEFLNLTLRHEQTETPSLVAFLAGLDERNPSIKRDMESGADLVRVMTVHAAKGLEARIVFLPDTCTKASGSHDPLVFSLGLDATDAPILAWSPGSKSDCAAVATAREAARRDEEDEHRRLLYVALTRAEERLYIAGFHGKNGPGKGCWYSMIEAALADWDMEEIAAFWSTKDSGSEDRLRRKKTLESIGNIADADATPPPDAEEEKPRSLPALLPSWLSTQPEPEEEARPPLRPSTALSAADSLGDATAGGFGASADLTALQRGRLIHLLLQYLPGLPPERRRKAALGYLGLKARYLDASAHAALTDEALAIIENPALRGLYLDRSMAEVAVAGEVTLPSGRVLSVNGRIDRLGETEEEVLLADYKTGAAPRNGFIPQPYLAQMALYRAILAPLWPQKPMRILLIWTASGTIRELSESVLRAALEA